MRSQFGGEIYTIGFRENYQSGPNTIVAASGYLQFRNEPEIPTDPTFVYGPPNNGPHSQFSYAGYINEVENNSLSLVTSADDNDPLLVPTIPAQTGGPSRVTIPLTEDEFTMYANKLQGLSNVWLGRVKPSG